MKSLYPYSVSRRISGCVATSTVHLLSYPVYHCIGNIDKDFTMHFQIGKKLNITKAYNKESEEFVIS